MHDVRRSLEAVISLLEWDGTVWVNLKTFTLSTMSRRLIMIINLCVTIVHACLARQLPIFHILHACIGFTVLYMKELGQMTTSA